MAGKPKQMSQIKQLIRLYHGGSGIKTIARILRMSKYTVRSYLKKMADGGFNTEELLKQEDPLLEKYFHSNMHLLGRILLKSLNLEIIIKVIQPDVNKTA